MGRSLMLLSLSRNHHLIRSLFLFSKRTFHNNNVLTSCSFNERETDREIERERQSFLVRRHCHESDAYYFSQLSTENWAPLREIRLPFFKRWRCLSGSCGGIFHLYDHLGIGLLWKPSTHEFKQLSSSKVPPFPLRGHDYEHYCLGFDSQSQDYKVVRFSTRDSHSQSQSRIELYSLQNDSWKEISEDIGEEWFHSYSTTKAYVNGRYYWFSFRDQPQHEKKIMSFDFTSEKFSHVILPPKITHSEILVVFSHMILRKQYDFKLVEFDGKLGLIKYSGKSYELFVLENDGSWTSQFQIHVGDDEMKALFLSSDGRFLFLQDFDDEDTPHEVMVYDLRIQELKKLSIYDRFARIFPYPVTVTPPYE